ncbi:Uma2 family endonuclease [Streptomyces laurentii]|uniref:Uma2 family endonuclease n=1 Tax=Streptomyces laurentii TaxID=39478 RepID=UPI00367CA61F
MAMALPVPGDEFPGDAVGDYEGASVEQTFELFSAVAPKGWRVELTEGEIKVVPPANGDHEEIVSEMSGQVRDQDKSMGRYTNIGLRLPDGSKVIPDLVIAPKGSYSDREDWHATSAILLVTQITSASTAGRDRVQKLRGYARADIPVYLVVDRDAGEITVHSGPQYDHYTRRSVHRLGAVAPLPDPLGFAFDTAEF